MRRFLLGAASMVAAAFGLPSLDRHVAAIRFPDRYVTRGRVNGHSNDCQNPMGTTPGRGLRRIQGRQARR